MLAAKQAGVVPTRVGVLIQKAIEGYATGSGSHARVSVFAADPRDAHVVAINDLS